MEAEDQGGELDRWTMLRPMFLTFHAKGLTWSNGSLEEESDCSGKDSLS